MKQVPFTVNIKITPQNPGKRFEHVRDMQKIATFIYNGLATLVPGTIVIAQPGGGQHRSTSGVESGAMGGLVYGGAVKPQFGDLPALVQVTGFCVSNSLNSQPYAELKTISAGQNFLGPMAHSWDANPSTTINNAVKALKSAIESAIASEMPSDVDFSVFRLEYSGIVFGDRGFHFPI